MGAQALCDLGQMIEAFTQHGQHVLPGLGQTQGACQADEKRHAELRLQLFHVLAHCGGRDVELFGRFGEAQVARGGLKGAQRVERGLWPGHSILL